MLNSRNNDNLQSPLHIAVSCNHLDVINLILTYRKNIDIELKDKIGRTPILHAARKGFFECFKILYEACADISQFDDFGDGCLHYVALHAHHEILEFILHKTNLNVNKQNR